MTTSMTSSFRNKYLKMIELVNLSKCFWQSFVHRFIPFGQEQDCFCGASACRGKLGRKPSKQKLSATMALEIVAREVLMSTKCKKSKLCNSVSILHLIFVTCYGNLHWLPVNWLEIYEVLKCSLSVFLALLWEEVKVSCSQWLWR